jgi:hypothetical protein
LRIVYLIFWAFIVGMVMDLFLRILGVAVKNLSSYGFNFLLESSLIYLKLKGSLLEVGLTADMKK